MCASLFTCIWSALLKDLVEIPTLSSDDLSYTRICLLCEGALS